MLVCALPAPNVSYDFPYLPHLLVPRPTLQKGADKTAYYRAALCFPEMGQSRTEIWSEIGVLVSIFSFLQLRFCFCFFKVDLVLQILTCISEVTMKEKAAADNT